MQAMLPVPTLRHLYTLFASLEQPVDFGRGPFGYRRALSITSGYFKGDRLKGKILTGGGDHLIMLKDGEVYTDTRYNLQTDDGAFIYVQTKGCRRGPKHLLRKILDGHTLTEQESEHVVFHMSVQLETGDKRYEWLNKIIVVATARRTQFGIGYDAYELCSPSPPPLPMPVIEEKDKVKKEKDKERRKTVPIIPMVKIDDVAEEADATVVNGKSDSKNRRTSLKLVI